MLTAERAVHLNLIRLPQVQYRLSHQMPSAMVQLACLIRAVSQKLKTSLNHPPAMVRLCKHIGPQVMLLY